MNKKFKLEIGGRNLQVEIKNLAEQAAASCLVQYGDTLVLGTVVMSDETREGIDFFPLTVDYEERYYAAGKILGSRYIRRESRPSDEAILTSRLIDRAIRPRFPKDLRRGVQTVVTCLSWDRENDPDIIGLIAASLVLSLSNIPWSGPIAVVRVGKLGNEFILNPTYEQREGGNLDLVITGVEKDGEICINMIEAEGEETSEEVILEAVDWAQPYLKKIIDFQNQIISEAGKEKIFIETPPRDLELEKEIKEFLGDRLEKALFQKGKGERMEEVNSLKKELVYFIEGKYPGMGKTKYVKNFLEQEINRLLHKSILESEKGQIAGK